MKGRGNSTSTTVKETVRINIDELRKAKCINYGSVTTFTSTWSNNYSIQISIKYTNSEKEAVLSYYIDKKPIELNILIDEVKSNLGKGFNLYFICPVTGSRCKTLFCCYGSEIFKSMQAYQNRIYYPSQISSKVFRTWTRYFSIEDKINKLAQLRNTKCYKQKETKRLQRLTKLLNQRVKLDELKNEEFDLYLSKLIGGRYTI